MVQGVVELLRLFVQFAPVESQGIFRADTDTATTMGTVAGLDVTNRGGLVKVQYLGFRAYIDAVATMGASGTVEVHFEQGIFSDQRIESTKWAESSAPAMFQDQ